MKTNHPRYSFKAFPSAALIAVLSVVLLGTGCTINSKLRSLKSETRELSTPPDAALLRPGDQLTLFFTVKGITDTGRYVIEPGDQIRVVVADREDLSRIFTVAPDGFLYLPACPPIPAGGAAVTEIESAIIAALKPLSITASIFVSMERFNTLSRDLITSLSPLSSQGPYFRTIVDADTAVTLPRLGTIPCGGLTVADFLAVLEQHYAKRFSNLQVIPVYENSSLSSITVLGEVNRAGAFPVSGRVTLATALGLAGGWMRGAAMSSVIIVQCMGKTATVRRVNFTGDLISASLLSLSAGDIVFVPARPIVDLDVFVDQYIRQLLPISVGASVILP